MPILQHEAGREKPLSIALAQSPPVSAGESSNAEPLTELSPYKIATAIPLNISTTCSDSLPDEGIAEH
jgi:hypothetical protein